MKRHFAYVPAFAFIAAICLVACSKVEQDNSIDNAGKEGSSGQGWTVSIQATKAVESKALSEDSDTHKLIATFETTDDIYVYNKTKNVVDTNPLHPDRNGASVLLTGTLSGDYDENDELVLCYKSSNNGIFSYYTGQKGTLETVADFAKATITVSANDAATKSITGAATFENMQSIFGFRFTDGTSVIPTRAVRVSTSEAKLVYLVRSLTNSYIPAVSYGASSVVADNPISGTVYMALCNENTGDDTYHFYVNDGDGHLYYGEKAAPGGKIVNGKFYTSTVTLTPVALPTVTLTETGMPVGPNSPWEPTLAYYGWYNYMFGYANYGDLTISGNTNGCWFEWMAQSGSGLDKTVTLDGATVTNPEEGSYPIENQSGTLTIVLYGDNSITTDGRPAIAYNDTDHIIRFKGNGTLTITSSESSYGCEKGLRCYGYSSTNPGRPTAADGYELTISAGTDNGDGTTTWVYSVRPLHTYTIGAMSAYVDGGDPLTSTTGTGADIATSWTDGDKVWVCYDDNAGTNPMVQATVLSIDGSGKATIAAEMPDAKDGGYAMFGYPFAHWNYGLDPHGGQHGTLSEVLSNHAAVSGGSLMSVSGSDVSLLSDVDMSAEMCIWKLSFTDGGNDITDQITALTIDCGNYDEYVVTPSSQGTIYVALYPQVDSDITFTVKTVSGLYTASANGITLDPGYVYTSEVTLLSSSRYPIPLASVDSIDLGAVIGADGYVYLDDLAAEAAGTTAEAMIAYVHDEYGTPVRLALALENVGNYKYNMASIMVSYWANSHTISDLDKSAWRLPTETDWDNMAESVDLNAALVNAKGANTILYGTYWSSTGSGSSQMVTAHFETVSSQTVYTKGTSSTSTTNNIRACIPF